MTTIEIPDWDPHLDGHGSIRVGDTVHAVVTDYSDPNYSSKTECEIVMDVDAKEIEPKGDLVQNSAGLCPDCWPAKLIDENP